MSKECEKGTELIRELGMLGSGSSFRPLRFIVSFW